MALSLVHVTFDCSEPPRLAAFWSAPLDRPVAAGATEFFTSLEPAGPGAPAWFFIKVPEPKSTKNRVHVDLEAADRPAEVARLISLGATAVSDHDEWGASWTMLTDPEGKRVLRRRSGALSDDTSGRAAGFGLRAAPAGRSCMSVGIDSARNRGPFDAPGHP